MKRLVELGGGNKNRILLGGLLLLLSLHLKGIEGVRMKPFMAIDVRRKRLASRTYSKLYMGGRFSRRTLMSMVLPQDSQVIPRM